MGTVHSPLCQPRNEWARSVKRIFFQRTSTFLLSWIRLLWLAGIFFCGDVRGDAIVVSQAMLANTVMEAFVEEDSLRVEFEVGGRDLMAYADLLPDKVRKNLPGVESMPYEERIQRFFERSLILQADGEPMVGRLVSIAARDRQRRDPIGGEALTPKEGEKLERVLFIVLEYKLDELPETVLVAATPRDDKGRLTDIGFVLYHQGIAVNDFRFLYAGLAVDLDWDDPWYSRFQSRPMKRTFDAPLNVFLYAEPFEIRVEVVVRPLDLQPFVDLGLEGKKTIAPGDYGRIQAEVAEFLGSSFELEIDGEKFEPVLDRVNFLRRTLRSSTVIDPPEELNIYTAQMGVIFVAPTRELPQEASVTWSVFPEKIDSIPTSATDEAGPFPGRIDREDPVLIWKNYLKNPTDYSARTVGDPPPAWKRALFPVGLIGMAGALCFLGIGGWRTLKDRQVAWVAFGAGGILLVGSWSSLQAAGGSRIDSAEAEQIVENLLYNIYRSFDFRQEEAVYDMLSSSVSGPLLEQAYLETRKSLVLQNQGGARAKVNQIVMNSAVPEPDSDEGFRVQADWEIAASVGHWGHLHTRKNRYQGVLTIRPVEGAWKITGMDMEMEERVQ